MNGFVSIPDENQPSPSRSSSSKRDAGRTHLIIHGDATRSVHIFHWGSTWPMVDQLSSRLAAVLALPSENLAEPRSETRTVTGSQGHSYEAYQAYVHGTLGSTHSDRWMVSLLYPLSHQLLCIVVTLHYRMSWNRRHREEPREPRDTRDHAAHGEWKRKG